MSIDHPTARRPTKRHPSFAALHLGAQLLAWLKNPRLFWDIGIGRDEGLPGWGPSAREVERELGGLLVGGIIRDWIELLELPADEVWSLHRPTK